jgi:spore germination protein KC
MGIGVDAAADGEYEVTVQIAQPSNLKFMSGGDNQDAYFNASSTGIGIQQQMHQFETELSREIYNGHMEMIVIGKEAAEGGLEQIMDYFYRESEARFNIPIVIADGKASDLLDVELKLERLPVSRLAGMLSTNRVDMVVRKITMDDFLRNAVSNSSATLPIIEQLEEGALETKGVAVFDKYKMVGELDQEQARSMLILTNKYGGGIATIELPDNGVFTFEITKSSASVKPECENGELSVNAEVYLEFRVSDVSEIGELYSDEARHNAEKMVNAAMFERLADVITRSRELNADVFDFADIIYCRYPRESESSIKNWDEEFRNLPVSISVTSKMYSSGAVLKNIQ